MKRRKKDLLSLLAVLLCLILPGLDARLKKRGIQEGNTVRIGEMEFEFRE